MKSAVAHAIKTLHFPDFTELLSKLWKMACKGITGYHFDFATEREKAIMRGWTINYEKDFYFTSTHDLCDCRFSKGGLERMVRTMYAHDQMGKVEALEELRQTHPEWFKAPKEGKELKDMTLDEYIFGYCSHY